MRGFALCSSISHITIFQPVDSVQSVYSSGSLWNWASGGICMFRRSWHTSMWDRLHERAWLYIRTQPGLYLGLMENSCEKWNKIGGNVGTVFKSIKRGSEKLQNFLLAKSDYFWQNYNTSRSAHLQSLISHVPKWNREKLNGKIVSARGLAKGGGITWPEGL